MVSQFGSLGYTIMGKTADLTVVQKAIIDTLHKEGKLQTPANPSCIEIIDKILPCSSGLIPHCSLDH